MSLIGPHSPLSPRRKWEREVKGPPGKIRTKAEIVEARRAQLASVEKKLVTGKSFVTEHSLLKKEAYQAKKIQELFGAHDNLFAHICCGSTAEDTVYEGLPAVVPIQFLDEQLHWARDNKGSLISSPSPKIAEVRKEVQELIANQKMVDDFCALGMPPKDELEMDFRDESEVDPEAERGKITEVQAKVIHGCAEKICEKINGLKTAGESCSFPCGPAKHAMLLKAVKKENGNYTFYIYNAQEDSHLVQGGKQFVHGEKTPFFKTSPCIAYDDVGEEDFILFKHLLKVQFSPTWYPNVNEQQFTQNDVMKCFGTQLSEKVVSDLGTLPEARLASLFITEQRAGTCTQKTLRAWLLCNGPNRRFFKEAGIEARLLSLINFYAAKKDVLADPKSAAVRAQLREGAENLCKKVEKYFPVGGAAKESLEVVQLTEEQARQLLATARDVIVRLDEVEAALRKKESDSRAFEPGRSKKEVEREQREKLAKSIASEKGCLNLQQRRDVKSKSPSSIPDKTEKIKTVEELDARLTVLCRRRKGLETTEPASLRNLAFEVESFLLEALPELDNPIWKKVNPKTLGMFQHLLPLYMKASLSGPSAVHPRQQITCALFFAITHKLALLEDSRQGLELLSGQSFGVAAEFSQLLEDEFFAMESPLLFQKAKGLQEYFASIKKGAPLFAFQQDKVFIEKSVDNDFYSKILKLPGREVKGQKGLVQALKEVYLKPSGETREVNEVLTAFLWRDFGREQQIGEEETIYPSMLEGLGLQHIAVLKEVSCRCLAAFGRLNPYGYLDHSKPPEISIETADKGDITTESSGCYFQEALFPGAKNLLSEEEQGRITALSGKHPLSSKKSEILSQNRYLMDGGRELVLGKTARLLVDCSNPKVRTAALLRQMTEHIDFVESEENQRLLELLFFRPVTDTDLFHPLFKELEENPDHTLELVKKFIGKGLGRYFTAQPGRVPKVSESLFFVRFAQRIKQAYREVHGREPPFLYKPSLIKELFEGLEKLPAQEKRNAPQFRGRVHLHRITEILYRKEARTLSNDEWVDLLESWAEVQQLDLLKDMAPSQKRQVTEARRLVLAALPDLADTLKGARVSIIGNALLKRLMPHIKRADFTWNYSAQATISCSGWSIDCNTGTVTGPEGAMVRIGNTEIPKIWGIEDLFGNRRAERVWREGEILHFRDRIYGHVRFVNDTVQREIDGKWYVFLDYLPGEIHKVFKSRDLTHWSSIDEGKELYSGQMYVCDRDTGKVLYEQSAEGAFFPYQREVKGEKLSLRRIKTKTSLERIENREGILCWEDDAVGKALRIEMPRIKTASGASLSFVSDEEGRWALESNLNYVIVPQENGLLTTSKGVPLHNNYILLEHKKTKKRQLLFSNHPDTWSSEAYSSQIKEKFRDLGQREKQWGKVDLITVDLVEGKLVADSVEGKLFLALQFLLARDYQRAAGYLKEIGTADELSEQAVLLLRDILLSKNDLSPSSCAIRLYAFSLAKNLLPLSKNPFVERITEERFQIKADGLPPNLSSILKKNLDRYLRGNVSESLRLLPETELRVLQSGFVEDADYAKIRKELLGGHEVLLKFAVGKMPTPKKRFEIVKLDWGGDFSPLAIPGELEEVHDLPLYGEKLGSAHFLYCYRDLVSEEVPEVDKDRILQELEFAESLIWSGRELFGSLENFKILLYTAREFPKEVPEIDFLNEEGAVDKGRMIAWFEALSKVKNEKGTPEKWDMPREVKKNYRDLKASSVRLKKTSKEKEIGLLKGASPLLWKPLVTEESYSELVRSYFTRTTEKRAASPVVVIDKGLLSEKEKEYADAVERERDFFNQDMKGVFQDRVTYSIKEPEVAKVIEQQLEARIDEKRTAVAEWEKVVETSLNAIPHGHLHALARAPRKKKGTVLDVMRLCLRVRPEKRAAQLRREWNSSLSLKEAQQIIDSTLHYMTDKTELQHLERSLKVWNGSSKGDYTEFVETLEQPRGYDPVENSYALYFECVSGLRMRPKQAVLIQNLFQRALAGEKDIGKARDVVFQLMMGGGKTSVILSVLLDMTSEMGFPAVLLLHPSQFDAVKGNLKKYQKERFGKELTPIDFTRAQLGELSTLELILDRMKQARLRGDPLLMKSSMPQVLELEFLSVSTALLTAPPEAEERDFLFRAELPPVSEAQKLKKKQRVLGEILSLYKESIAMVDEVHLVLNLRQELNFPDSQRTGVKAERIELVKDVYAVLSDLVKLRDNEQAEMTAEIYTKDVLPEILTGLLKRQELLRTLPPEHHEAYKRYVQGKIDSSVEDALQKGRRDFKGAEGEDAAFLRYLWKELGESPNPVKRETAHLIALSRWLLQTVVPLCLSKSTDRDHGRSSSGTGEVRPFVASKKEAPTDFGNPYEALCRCFQTALTKPEAGGGITGGQILRLAKQMQTVAAEQARERFESVDKMPIAKEFFELTGVSLHEVAGCKDPEDVAVQRALIHVNTDKERILAVEAETATMFVSFYPSFLSANPFDLVDQHKGMIACSGTPGEIGTFHTRFGVEGALELDKGTEGRILAEMMKRAEENPDCLHVIKDDSATSIFRQFKGEPNKRCLIDTGGLLKRYTGMEFATEYLKFFQGDSNREAVLFFHQYTDPKSGRRETVPAILKKGGTKPILLKNTTKEEIKRCGVDEEKIFYYYDEYHTTGTDIPMPPGTLGFLTLDPLYMTQSSLAQGALRARRFFKDQDVHYLVKKDSVPGLLGGKADASMIFPTAIKNQAIEKAEQVKSSYEPKLRRALRAACLQHLMDLIAKGEDTGEFTEASRKYFETSFQDNPLEQFGHLMREVVTEEHFVRLRDRMIGKFRENLGEYFKEAQFTKVETECEEVIKQLKSDIRSGKVPRKMETGGGASSLGTEVQTEVQLEVAREVEAEMELSTEMRQELDRYLDAGLGAGVKKEKEWQNLRDLKGFPVVSGIREMKGGRDIKGSADLEVEESTDSPWGVGVRTLREYLHTERGLYQEEYERCFPDELPLYVSDNFCFTAHKSLPLFHPAHKTAKHILAVQEGDKMKFLLLSHGDHEAFQTQMREWCNKGIKRPFWILNSSGDVVEDCGTRFTKSREVEKLFCYVHFFNGDALALEKDRDTEELLKTGDTGLKKRFLQLRVERDPKSKTRFYRSKLLCPEGQREEGGRQFIADARGERNIRAQVELYSDVLIRDMKAREVPYLPPGKVPLLQTKEQIQALPKELISSVTKEQVLHLTQEQVPYLKTKEQIQAVTDLECFKGLTKEQVPHFSAEQATLIPEANKEWLTDLRPEVFAAVFDQRVGWLDERVSLEKMRDKVPCLTTEQLARLPQRFYQYLSQDQVRALGAVQEGIIHALPEAAVAKIEVGQVGFLQNEQLHYLTKEAFAAISDAQLGTVAVGRVLLSKVSDAQAPKLTNVQWQALLGAAEEDDEEEIARLVNLLSLARVRELQGLDGVDLYKYFRESLVQALGDDDGAIFAALPETAIAYVTEAQLLHLSPDQVVHLSTELFQKIPLGTFQAIGEVGELIEKLSKEQMKALTDTQWDSIGDEDWTKDLVPFATGENAKLIPDDFVKHVTKEQVPFLTEEQIPHLPQDEELIHAVPGPLVSSIPGDFVAFASPTQLPHLGAGQFSRLTKGQVSSLSEAQIPSIPSELVRYVTKEQVAHLKAEQIAHLSEERIPDVSDGMVQHISDEMVKHVTKEQVEHLEARQIRHLSAREKIRAVTPTLFAGLNEAQLPEISVDQAKSIDEDHASWLDYLAKDVFAKISDQQLGWQKSGKVLLEKLPKERAGKLTPEQWEAIRAESTDSVEDHTQRIQEFVGVLKGNEVNNLPLAFVPYLSQKQVKHISQENAAWLDCLPKDAFAGVTDKQIAWVKDGKVLLKKLPKERAKRLTREQWIAIDQVAEDGDRERVKELVGALKGKEVNQLSDAFAPYLSKKQVEHISQDNAKWLDRLTKDAFVGLTDEQIGWVKDGKTLLKKLPKERAEKLTREQWQAIDREWRVDESYERTSDLVEALQGENVNDLPPGLVPLLSSEQAGGLEHPDLIAQLQPAQVKHLSPKVFKHLKTDAEVIKQVPTKYANHLTIKQLNARYYAKPYQRFTNPIKGIARTLLSPFEAAGRFVWSLFVELPRAVINKVRGKDVSLGKQLVHTFFLSWLQPLLTNVIGIFHYSYYMQARAGMRSLDQNS